MKANNIYTLHLEADNARVCLMSDIHWDNPKCIQSKLIKDLDYCLEHNIPVLINGDMFCLMQGKGDKRGSKSDIRPEHNVSDYFDAIAETAVEFFRPYASIIKYIGYGNHETSIIKFRETDVLRNFVTRFNHDTGANVQLGGYGGWIVCKVPYNSTSMATFIIKHFHGSGGGGVVTRGSINLTRALAIHENMDIYWMGHIHEMKVETIVREYLASNTKSNDYDIKHKEIKLVVSGSYKEEFGDGSKGWHVERGAPVKTIGSMLCEFVVNRATIEGKMKTVKQIAVDKLIPR